RHMHGFGSHTYSFISADNRRYWVKFHFKTQQGIKNLTDEQAAAIVANDRESSQRDLYEAIERKDFPRWTMYVQIMPEAEAATYRFHPFDLTKVWSKKDYPLIEVGYFELNRNPDNYFQDVEQAAFTPANVVPGIGFSPDRMLQGRLFSYGDAQRYRLGVNHHQIPVNAPRCPFHSYHRDGAMRVDGNHGSRLHYEPNSYGEWQDQRDFSEPPLALAGAAARYDYREDDSDYFTQPGDLFRLMDSDAQQRLFENTARAMNGVERHIKLRPIRHYYLADPAYGAGIANAQELSLEDALACSARRKKQARGMPRAFLFSGYSAALRGGDPQPPSGRPSRSSSGLRKRPVWDAGWAATCSGVPVAMICPPREPPSGPRSTSQSAVLITSRLCSITTTVLPWSRRRCSTSSSCWMSAKCRPVVGSSR